MAKKRAVERSTRSEKRGPPGPTPLVLIAGLPEVTALPAAATINNDRNTRWRAVTTAFVQRDTAIYADLSSALELGRLACEFAFQRARDADGVPTPSRIVVAHVGEDGTDQLWKVFGHAVLPLPLVHPDWGWPKGRHWRHEIETVNMLVKRALGQAESERVEGLRLRLEARRSDDVLLLPGRNFHVDPNQLLVERFRDFMSGRIDEAGVEAGVQIERFPYERLALFYNRMGGRNKRFAIDNRGIVFAKSNYGQHGANHIVEADAEITAILIQRILESRYRFGTPLQPDGFQHDAQLEKGAQFISEIFDCVLKGPTPISGDHANVFPSDVVT